MMSFEQLHRAWQRVAENRIRAAQDEGAFDDLPGYGKPLEEIMDLNDAYGWIRRTMRDCRAMQTEERCQNLDYTDLNL